MKQARYTFPAECHPDLAGKEYLAYETVTAGLIVVDFGEEGRTDAALTHSGSGWALIPTKAKKRPADLCKIAGALGGLDLDFTKSAPEVMATPAGLPDLQFRIFLLLVLDKQRMHPATVQAYRIHIREKAAKFVQERERQLAEMR